MAVSTMPNIYCKEYQTQNIKRQKIRMLLQNRKCGQYEIMKNAVIWDIKTAFSPHRRHITCPLQSSAN
jgi:hypothetical protein